ncbi:hypothetical protein NCCP2716_29110 [Sporosarcina sp. NCCP-2716]|uniref:DUF6518 family protein n=1 Tax=Sporosarcina sp. NCCP-2716 TaxID=2943679 RepID=UPI00203ACD5B|nr:DUF6518 family protein [Sporosarcina sp. NCCP-2716]GKV70413.1 hypothetical protein NCCP2716_29110 [Sporosarcina sp. NCCP-2716]
MIIKYKLPEFVIFITLGAFFGLASKYLDNIAVEEGDMWLEALSYFGDLSTRLGIWVLLATFIAAFSKTFVESAINTFLFFVAMLFTYYLYSAYLFGFFPFRYLIIWGALAIASPLFAMIAWEAKNNERRSLLLPALPMGLMLSLSLGMGLFYIHLNYIEELIMYFILALIFYRSPKQMAIVIVLSFVVGFIIEQVSPFHF